MKSCSLYMVCLNPAMDLSGHVDDILLDEKNYVSRQRIEPGGNAVNAARIARRLGGRPSLFGFAGGPAGAQVTRLLRVEGVTPRFTPIRGSTRTNVTVTNNRDHRQTRLTFPGPKISQAEIRRLHLRLNTLQAPGIFVLGGSLPHGLQAALYVDLIRSAQKRGLEVIVDVPAAALKNILSARLGKLLMIKPNRTEFETLTGRRLPTKTALAREILKLHDRSEIVCVSAGADGAFVGFQGHVWSLRPPKIRSQGSVGAGDSMVGAIATQLALRQRITQPRSQADVLSAARRGVAAGAATAATEGTSLGQPRLIHRLVSDVRSRQIL